MINPVEKGDGTKGKAAAKGKAKTQPVKKKGAKKGKKDDDDSLDGFIVDDDD